MLKVRVLDHPYIQVVLTTLRDKNIRQIEFRKAMVRLGRAMGFEITRDLELERVEVETPLGVKTEGVRFKDMDKVVIITVLRAGMPMTEGLIKIFYNARQGVVSARRVEEKGMRADKTFDVEITYVRLPKISNEDTVIIVDPMLATGSTIREVLKIVLSKSRPRKVFVVGAIATPLAIDRVREVVEEYNLDATIYTAAVDLTVNEKGYIVPGLGDAGDRAFGE
ncbi:uracil phosphoribosyltransferase [Thermogladius calderae 1633]|uniref:Uracil phosphoribosyltransferase n=1 Tax=Thermogladius calderae (strain DSM 22663 / VKM B-2946 / 1633) TaxID=1184251 RepID=I3TFX7_THEC1|nr:uracil phosphoribosyltransferase [Thermogladius calderae]AFK51665.1 uracil phosphoribosyltransferase [Thermogladius calderae 1633]